MNRCEIGLGIQSDKPVEAYGPLAAHAEEWGFDVLSVFGDLMYQPPIVPLLEMARATTRVRLGPACLNPYSMAPYEIAGQIAGLDLASKGRAYLGLARGTWLGAVGLEQPNTPKTLREAAQVIAMLLSGDTAGFTGEVFSLAPGTALRYRVERPSVPLLIGTWGRQTAALAGRIANEVKIGGSANPLMVGQMQSWLGNPDVSVCIGAVTVVDEDHEAARALARREVAMYIAVVADLDPTVEVDPEMLEAVRTLVAEGRDAEAGNLIPDDTLDLFAFSGDPEHVAHQAQLLIDTGAGRVEFGTPHGRTPDIGIALLGEEVLPRLKRG